MSLDDINFFKISFGFFLIIFADSCDTTFMDRCDNTVKGRGRNSRVIAVKTKREKRAKANRDAERAPVKIAERMEDVTNCKKKG